MFAHAVEIQKSIRHYVFPSLRTRLILPENLVFAHIALSRVGALFEEEPLLTIWVHPDHLPPAHNKSCVHCYRNVNGPWERKIPFRIHSKNSIVLSSFFPALARLFDQFYLCLGFSFKHLREI